MTTTWIQYVRIVGCLRVDARRTTWQARGDAGVHAEIDEILDDADAGFAGVPATADEAWDAVQGDPLWQRITSGFGLNGEEQQLLALLCAAHTDPRIGRLLGYLDDDRYSLPVSVAAAAGFFGWEPGVRPGPAGALVRWSIAEPDEAAGHPWQPGTAWTVDPDIVALLCGAPGWASFWPGLHLVDGPTEACLHSELVENILTTVQALRGAVEIELVGRTGSGRRTLLHAVCARLGRPALLVTDPLLGVRALRTARLLEAIPVWVADGPQDAPVFDDRRGAVTLVARVEPDAAPGHMRLSYCVPDPTRAERVALWSQRTCAPVPTAVEAWALTPAEIAAAADAAPAGARTVGAVLRRRLGAVSKTLMTPLACPYGWEDLVLAPDVRRQLADIETQVRLAGAVLDDWGLRRLTPGSRGTTALFAGPSGTGKTMAAQVLARELDLDLYRVDLAEVVNKYIGETEKRLAQVFDECERSNVMVLFDEADALFGQRTQVRDAHDRFANIEIDYLLQRMESFDGVAILATNRKGDLDSAFIRRLRVIVSFRAPTAAERLRMWQIALPATTAAGAQLSVDIDHDRLASLLTLTGAEIKSIVLAAAFAARARDELIGPDDVLSAARSELAKRGAVIREPMAPPVAPDANGHAALIGGPR